jgi:hypothetical protein
MTEGASGRGRKSNAEHAPFPLREMTGVGQGDAGRRTVWAQRKGAKG